MTDWKGKFEDRTKGGCEYEIFAERDGELYGRIEKGGRWFAEHWRLDGTANFDIDSLIPKRPPLRVEDVPLGLPCKLKDGCEFTPYWIDRDGDLNGVTRLLARGYGHECLGVDAIDPASIIETREVWIAVVPGCSGFVRRERRFAEILADNAGGFVYGPIRVPVKPL